jgi:uncharacterized protein (DUF433 family)
MVMTVDTPAPDRSADSPIVRDPDILGGQPVFRGTRVPVDVLFDNLADGLTLDEILRAYPTLDREDVMSALELARKRLLDDAA